MKTRLVIIPATIPEIDIRIFNFHLKELSFRNFLINDGNKTILKFHTSDLGIEISCTLDNHDAESTNSWFQFIHDDYSVWRFNIHLTRLIKKYTKSEFMEDVVTALLRTKKREDM